MVDFFVYMLIFFAFFGWGVYAGVTAPWRVPKVNLDAANTRADGWKEACQNFQRRALLAEQHLSSANATLDAKLKEMGELIVSVGRKQGKINAIQDAIASIVSADEV